MAELDTDDMRDGPTTPAMPEWPHELKGIRGWSHPSIGKYLAASFAAGLAEGLKANQNTHKKEA